MVELLLDALIYGQLHLSSAALVTHVIVTCELHLHLAKKLGCYFSVKNKLIVARYYTVVQHTNVACQNVLKTLAQSDSAATHSNLQHSVTLHLASRHVTPHFLA